MAKALVVILMEAVKTYLQIIVTEVCRQARLSSRVERGVMVGGRRGVIGR